MTRLNEKEGSLRSYLLGELSSDEQRQIEEQLLLDSNYMELLLSLEAELIDSYLSGELSEREHEQFQKLFLTSPERQRKLRMTKALKRYVSKQTVPTPAPAIKPKRSWWQGLLTPAWGGAIYTEPRVRDTRALLLTPAWGGAIAAMLLLGIGFTIWRNISYRSLTDKGRLALQAAFRESPTEARMTGFNWTPQSITLGSQPKEATDNTSVRRAFSYFGDAVDEQPGPDSHYALGQYYLATRNLDSAVNEFRQALESMPKNAKLQSDMGAALLELSKRKPSEGDQSKSSESSSEYLSRSLEHLDQALKLDDSLLEALFNRALCYQYMQLPSLAEADWRSYLNRDPDSPWAEEARRHLKEVEDQKPKTSQSKEEQFKEFLGAHQTGNRATAWKIVSQTREIIKGRLIWWQTLDDFFKLLTGGQQAEATARIEVLQYVGYLELYLGEEDGLARGDPYISELAEFYRSTSPQQRASLSEAHKQINEGNQKYLDGHLDEAIDSYKRAREIYARHQDEGEALLADFLIVYCYIDQGEKEQKEQSEFLLDRLVSECKQKNYLWLLAQSFFSQAMMQERDAEYSKALENTKQALQISEEISDSYNTQRSLAQIADLYRKLGNYELSATYLNRCLEQINVVWPGNRQMWRSCNQLTQVLAARRFNAASAAYASEALRIAFALEDPYCIYVSYVHLALIYSKQQNYTEAIRLAQLGLDVAPNADSKAYASLQLGHLYGQSGDINQALSDYDQCINYIDSIKSDTRADRLPALRYAAHKGRLFCLFAQGNDIPAKAELDLTVELLKKNRKNIREDQNRNTFFNVEQSVYDAAIDFEHTKRNDDHAVFAYLEESRAQSLLQLITNNDGRVGDGEKSGLSQPVDLAETQRRLPDETQLIEYAVLDNKLLIYRVSKSEFSVKEVQISLKELTDKVLNFRQTILNHTTEPLTQAQELYNLLISQIELTPEKGKQICIVPDKILNNLPFAALVSPTSGSYLIEDYYLTVAPSATIYLACSERTNHTNNRNDERLLAVGNPAFDSKAYPLLPALPSTQQQVEKIASFYRSPSVLTDTGAKKEAVKRGMEASDVIHLASHYVVYEGNPMNSRLLLAQEPRKQGEADSSAGVLQASEVYGLKLQRRAPLVILAACESGVEHYYNGEGMIGMSRVFIAAGAPVVVASLWPVDAYATDELMVNFHKHRIEGLSTSESLRLAQIDLLRNPSKKNPYYWAGFATIGGSTKF